MEIFFSKYIKIEDDKDYSPGAGIIPENSSPIVALHITRELNGYIYHYNINGEKTEFPPTAFVPGGIYNFPTSKIEYFNSSDDKAIFGCTLPFKPYRKF